MHKKTSVLNEALRYKDKTYNPFQEEIAKTYLKTSGRPPKKKRLSLLPRLGWIVIILALFLVFFIIGFNSMVDIKILKVAPLVDREYAAGESRALQDAHLFFVKRGEPNKAFVNKAFFVGDARASSKMTDDGIVLHNSEDRGWASYRMELKESLDFNKFDIRYTARGKDGGEWLVLIIADRDNRAYRIADDISSKLTTDWQAYSVNFKAAGDAIDLSRVSIIRFEFGSLTAGNKSGATIFLKDVYLTKAKRLKWP